MGRMIQSTDSDPRKNTPYEGNLEMFLISNVSFAGSVLFSVLTKKDYNFSPSKLPSNAF